MPKSKCFFPGENLEEAIILDILLRRICFSVFAFVSSIIRPLQTKQCPEKRVKARKQSSLASRELNGSSLSIFYPTWDVPYGDEE